MRFCMIFEPESARANAFTPGAAQLVEDAAEILLLDSERGWIPWGLPGDRTMEPIVTPDAIW
jgi:hypothetical protein